MSLAGLLLALQGAAAAPTKEVALDWAARAGRIDAWLTRLAGFDYGGSILIEREGELLLRRAYGFADRTTARAYTPETAFDIGSLTKQFTAAAVLELERRGKLALSDPIARFIPDAPADKAGITLEQVLTHTAGLAGDFPVADPAVPDYDDVDEETAVRRILEQPLDSAPGSGWSYSNCGYVLLAALVHRASGQDYREFLRENLFAPGGLRHTGFWGAAPDVPVALGQDGFGNVLHDPARMRATWFDLGGGEVWSTLDDLCAWIHALSESRVLTPELCERLLEPRTGNVSPRDGAYAYGWFVQQTPRGTRVIQHGGDYLGTGVELEWFVDEDVLLITSTNVRHDVYPTRNRVDRLLQGLLFDEHATPPPVPAFAALDAPPPKGLEGEYELESGGLVELRRINGRLYLGALGQAGTDVLAGSNSDEAAERAWRSAAAQTGVEGALRHDLAALAPILGEGPNPAFAGLLQDELEALVRARGELRKVTLLGTFATGYPHGDPPSTETTLLRLECSAGSTVYAIRWIGRAIAWTEEVRMPLAACVPLQLAEDGRWVGWRILESQPFGLRAVVLDGAAGLELTAAGRTLRAKHR